MMKKNIKNFYRIIKVRVKRTASNIGLLRQLRHRNYVRKNERNKKLYNFILADEFIEKCKTGKKTENINDYYIHLYEFEDAYISNCKNCAFVQKVIDGQLYTLKESAGVIGRLDEPVMQYAPPYDLTKNNQEEDEVCMLCYLLGENYWHYIFDIIPRLMIMLKRGFKGKFLINNTWCARTFMDLLKMPAERLIINDCGTVIHASKVYLFSEMYGIELHGQLLEDTRNFLISEAEKNYGSLEDNSYPKRIYVPRVARRKIINEQEIIELLKYYGFSIMVPEKCCIHEQMKYFYNADIIVTPHGANCANLLFTKEGASMVECFGHMWVNPCMINTIALLETDYHMVCERLADYSKDAHKFSDYKINPLIMECTIKRIIEFRALAYDEELKIGPQPESKS